MNKKHAPVHQIELRISELSALFNSMDPTPFHHRDLDKEAQEFLESWAIELPQNSRLRIILHIAHWPPEDPTALAADAIHNFFDYKGILLRRQLQLLLREGRISLLIGLSVLFLCLLGADLLTSMANNTSFRVLEQGLVIVGWVAMWRPVQIFLYDWWPMARRHRIYRNLHRASVSAVPESEKLAH